MEVNTPSFIENYAMVTHAFGRWPSFHDGYLYAFAKHGEVIECEIHGWNLTSEIDKHGFFIREKHYRVAFKFQGVHDEDLAGLERCEVEFGPNILDGVWFSRPDEISFEVRLSSVIGGEYAGRFRARSGAVTSICPCDEQGQICRASV